MTETYAESRIRTALKENTDSAAKARQAVMRAALEDQKLMIELVAPHLSGIVAYAISRVEAGEGVPQIQPATPDKPKGRESSFGMEILRHVADDNAVVFGQESHLIPAKRPQAGQGHIDAINLIASKSGKAKK